MAITTATTPSSMTYPAFPDDPCLSPPGCDLPGHCGGAPQAGGFFYSAISSRELLSPLFPLVMKGVLQLKTFGETGFHCLAAARVADRYPREAFAAGLRVLGEGQLSLTKFLLVTDGALDVADFPRLWQHILERIQWDRDLFVFANVSQDTLDYTGPSVNKGSKAMMLGLGEKVRELPHTFHGVPARGVQQGPIPICRAPWSFRERPMTHPRTWLMNWPALMALASGPVILLVDATDAATCSLQEFLWTFFTRFEPANDIHGRAQTVQRFHVGLQPPIVFDCRMKPWYTDVLEVDPATKRLVDDKIATLLPPQYR